MSITQSPLYKIAVLGVRDFEGKLYTNYNYVAEQLEGYLAQHGHQLDKIQIITGGGGGVERMVIDWCKKHGVLYRTIPPDIQSYGTPKAFTIRNAHVVSEGRELVVFWDACIEVTTQAIITATHQQKRTTVFPLV